nr:DsaY [Streptomyces scopuliridis]
MEVIEADGTFECFRLASATRGNVECTRELKRWERLVAGESESGSTVRTDPAGEYASHIFYA